MVIERLAYEPFGKRRFASGSDDPNNTIVPQNTDRGYTNHEHLDELTLVHMNGRVYDPVVGRFMSADPQIQDPMNLQSYNRYAYVMNNPLMYTDPSGYFSWRKIFKVAVAVVKVAVVVVAIVVAPQIAAVAFKSSYVALATGATVAQAGTAFTAANIIGGAAAGAFVGATAGAAMGGSLQSALKGAGYGAISGGIFGGINSSYNSWNLERVTANSLAGGVNSELQGGKFADGAKASFVTSTASWGYEKSVGWAADPNPGKTIPGETTYDPWQCSSGCYNKNVSGVNTIEGHDYAFCQANDCSKMTPGALEQGGWVGNLVNAATGGAAVSHLHDYWGNNMSVSAFNVLNWPLMVPATAISYLALTPPSLAVALSVGR